MSNKTLTPGEEYELGCPGSLSSHRFPQPKRNELSTKQVKRLAAVKLWETGILSWTEIAKALDLSTERVIEICYRLRPRTKKQKEQRP